MSGMQEAEATLMKRLEPWQEILEDEVAEPFLDILLRLMKVFYKDHPYIEDFRGTYWFASEDGVINRVVKFADGQMTVTDEIPPAAHVKVTFKNGQALMKYLLHLKKDVLNLILNHEVVIAGNELYLYRFMFLSNHPLHSLLIMQNKYL